MADLPVDHRLAQRSLSGVIGGFDALDLQMPPEGILLFEQLAAGAHRSGPWRCLSPLGSQIHHPLQGLLDVRRSAVHGVPLPSGPWRLAG
jgi:hypothetical protein